jgi:hypothetical protein
MKPYDGGGWVGVSRIADEAALRAAYDQSGKLVMHLQRAVDGYDAFVRCVGVGPQVRYVSYRPDAPLHDRYAMQRDFLSDEQKATLRATTLTINSFFGWDFNSCEVLHKDGVFHPIDFANPCPDSQVTSLHYHFPWLVKALLRWAIYCGVTKRPYRPTLDWQRYFVVADRGGEQADKLARYGELSETHFDTARFEEFCARHLPHLDEVADAFFASEDARAAVRAKVTALFPEHEIDSFTELFFGRIQTWREQEGAKGLDLT